MIDIKVTAAIHKLDMESHIPVKIFLRFPFTDLSLQILFMSMREKEYMQLL